ncbi:MAG: hypothetical protein O2865_09750 [Planctomycetota bacterium]|nr:hypothetical protein [Planctomycetota bacterium]
MRTLQTLFTPVLLTAALAAQQTTATSALTITTNDPSIASDIAEQFGFEGEMPALGQNAVAIMSMDDGGMMNVRAGEGSDYLRIVARPAALMDMFGPAVDGMQAQAQAMGGLALGQAGFDFEQVDAMVEGLFSFPRQIASLTIVVPKEYAPGAEMDVHVSMVPAAGTTFAKLVDNLTPVAGGVPMPSSADNAMMKMAMNFDYSKIMPIMQPMMSLLSGMGSTTKEEKEEALAMSNEQLALMTGTMSMIMTDLENGGAVLMGVRDGAKFREIMQKPAYIAMQKRAGEASGMAETTIEPEAMVHRDTPVMKTTVIFDDPMMSPTGDGEQVSYSAVAGNVLISTMMSTSKGEITGLIDDILDKKIKMTALPANALMTMSVDLGEIADMIMMMSGMPGGESEIPSGVSAELTRNGNALDFKVHVK